MKWWLPALLALGCFSVLWLNTTARPSFAQDSPPPLKVTIDPPSGYFDRPVTVTIKAEGSCNGSVRLFYTVKSYFVDGDGGVTDPIDIIVDNKPYIGPFSVNEPVTVEARAECVQNGIIIGTAFTEKPTELVVCSPNCYWIAVIGDNGQDIRTLSQQIKQMVKTLEPWKSLRAQSRKIVVIPITQSSADLNCRELLLNGGTFPLCPDTPKVKEATKGALPANFKSGIQAHVVVTDVDCNCGTVENAFSPVAAVGRNATAALVAHELGHLTGKMVDEYFYQFNYSNGPLGNNCFATQNSCQAAIQGVPGASCSLGCRATNSWRPATQLMHNELDQPYGPLETCIMAKKIMDVIGTYPNNFGSCLASDPTPSPSPDPSRLGQYYGGTRGMGLPPTTSAEPTPTQTP